MAKFKKASKTQAKLRAAFFGPSGAGKTFTALRVATGLAGGGTIAVVDTERGSASKYADRFAFDVMELEDQTIDGYVQAIKDAAAEGYAVLVIDSLSHGWQTLLEEVEKLAKAKYRGNTWSAWSEGTPLQRKLVQAILTYPGHVIATMRSKTEWTTVDNGNGRKTPQRVGLAPEQGKGVEYEFDLLVEISTEHIANVIKDRTGRFQDKLLDRPGEEFGRELAAWLSDGAPIDHVPAALPASGAVQNSPAEPDTNTVPTNHAAPEFTTPENTPLGMAKLAISKARTLDALDAVRKKIDVRVAEKVFTQAEADDLVGMCRLRAEMLIGEEAVS